jgi:signal transduction histidine kinase
LQRLLVTVTPIIVAAVIMGIIGSHGSNRFLFAALIGPLVVVQVLAALSKRWPYKLRAMILIAPLLVATVLVYFLLGFLGNASVIGACAVVLTGLLFGRREMGLLLVVMGLSPVVAGVGMVSGWLVPNDGVDLSTSHALPWLRTTFVAFSTWTLLGLAITFVVQRIEGELKRTRDALADLREEEARRLKAEAERRVAEDAALQAQKMELVGRLAAGVAHDFNNLLGVVGGWAELSLESAASRSDRDQAREAIAGSIQQGKALTRQLLALARRDARTVSRVCLERPIRAGVTTLSRVLPASIKLSFEQRRSVHVEADEAELHQVLFNLVLNARDAMPEGGTIAVTTDLVALGAPLSAVGGEIAAGQWAKLTVEDSGSGIEPALQAKIFELFFTTKPIGLGTGLGLATVLRIARTSGGGVTLESSPGRGSCFSIYLPATTDSP